MGQREDNVTEHDNENGKCEHVVDECGACTPTHRKESEPLQDESGGQHDHDGAAGKNGIELLAGIELVDHRGSMATERLQPDHLVSRPVVDPPKVTTKLRSPGPEECYQNRHRQSHARPEVNVSQERST